MFFVVCSLVELFVFKRDYAKMTGQISTNPPPPRWKDVLLIKSSGMLGWMPECVQLSFTLWERKLLLNFSENISRLLMPKTTYLGALYSWACTIWCRSSDFICGFIRRLLGLGQGLNSPECHYSFLIYWNWNVLIVVKFFAWCMALDLKLMIIHVFIHICFYSSNNLLQKM